MTLLSIPRISVRTRRSVAWSMAWLAAVAGFELFGRYSTSDGMDLIGVAVVATLVAMTWREHKREPIGVLGWLENQVRALGKRLSNLGLQTGMDLRDEPPLRRAYPPQLVAMISFVLVLLGVVVLTRGVFPTEARTAVLGLSSTLYLFLLTGFWLPLTVGWLVFALTPVYFIHEYTDNAVGWEEAKRLPRKLTAMLAYLALLVLAAVTLPPETPVVLIVLGWVAILVASSLPNAPKMSLLWRKRGSDAEPAAFSWTTQSVANSTATAGVTLVVVFLARGDRWMGSEGSQATGVTAWLGWAFSWGAACNYTMLVADVLGSHLRGRFRNPASPRAIRVHVKGPSDKPDLLRDAAQALVDAGLEPSFEPKPESTDVVVELAQPGPLGEEGGGEVLLTWPPAGEWPLRVEIAEFQSPAMRRKLMRRGEMLRRRRLLGGIERLFKVARRSRYKRGTGFWLGPHLWFFNRLTRDANEEDNVLFCGPKYHPTVPIAARHHLYQVMRAAELDLIYVEDGVGFRRLRRVFASLFEYYDMFGGSRRAEDQQFSGLPGLRVQIKELGFDRTFTKSTYPAPDYEELGRARILHVYRDRGDDVVPTNVPTDGGSVPEPMLLG